MFARVVINAAYVGLDLMSVSTRFCMSGIDFSVGRAIIPTFKHANIDLGRGPTSDLQAGANTQYV